jgi:hypothetical protein
MLRVFFYLACVYSTRMNCYIFRENSKPANLKTAGRLRAIAVTGAQPASARPGLNR